MVPEEGADLKEIERRIKEMPNYFDEYNTTVNFIAEEELGKEHSGMPHGGIVISSRMTENMSKHRMEFSVKLDSNPEFTASILVAYARAVARLAKEGQIGARTVFDIPFAYLSPKSPDKLRKYVL